MQNPVAIPDDVAEPLTGESKTKILTREQARDMVRENFDWWYVEHAILKFNDIEFDDDTDIYGYLQHSSDGMMKIQYLNPYIMKLKNIA
ncbi:hypothetical protein SIID45300_03042 [Candidatus Magnetaquicoccaceae bacterium FCR-1]|uniref:Uncharacterized protein n=1 Tax=Candidatus Magnetaquiglobus chichijimensis TaxID=3141448 RepID=A0ABQ0CCU4_9PROT